MRMQSAIAFRWVKARGRRLLIVVVCLTIALLRMVFPSVAVDGITVWLICIAAICLILPDRDTAILYLTIFLPHLKKASIAGLEIELNGDVQRLVEKLEALRAVAPEVDERDSQEEAKCWKLSHSIQSIPY